MVDVFPKSCRCDSKNPGRFEKVILNFLLVSLVLLLATCKKPERMLKISTVNAIDAEIGYTEATLKGEITDPGSEAIEDHGILVSDVATQVHSSTKVFSLGAVETKGVFSVQATNLISNTNYYFCSYASVNSNFTYGETKQFTTRANSLASITSSGADLITNISARISGEITSDGGLAITKRGVCWNTAPNPTVTSCLDTILAGAGTGYFFGLIKGLSPSTKYYARLFAVNDLGTAYNNGDIIFTTYNIPVVSTTAISSVTNTSAVSGGNVTDDGGTPVTQRGVCWSTSTDPTVLLSTKTIDANGTGVFTSNITGLTKGNTYYVKAYATNQIGTAYGNQVQFICDTPPTAATSQATLIGTTMATLNGIVSTSGSPATVTFEYGLSTNYGTSISASPSTVSDNTPTTVSANVSGLSAGQTYHFRVKAVNTGGTTVGEDMTFETKQYPSALTDAVTNLGTTAVTLNGKVNANNSSTTVTFEYGLTTSYDLSVTAIQSPVTGNTLISVSANVTGLTEGTTYHYRVKAVSDVGTSYGSDNTFTLYAKPAATTGTANPVANTTATLNGTVNANNSSTSVSFEYGLTTSYGSSIVATGSPVSGSTSTNVSAALASLSEGTTYHFRVKAENVWGITYGNDQSFTTLKTPVALTADANPVGSTSATLKGTVNANNSTTTVTFEYGLSTSYTSTADGTPATVTGSSATPVSANISGLAQGTTYHFRVKASSAGGTSYGSDMSFVTLQLPVVTTTAVTSVTTSGGTSGGNVTSEGGASVTERGICWSLSLNPTVSDTKISAGSGAGTYICNLTGLTSGVLYHVRAYATNLAGTAYGADVTFTTLSVPAVNTNAISLLGSLSATSGGNVISTGGSTVTAKGVCWNTAPNPTLSNPQTIDGSGLGSFVSNLTSLSPNMTYYVRAYATNSIGTAYGNQVSFTTTPQVTDYDGNVYNTITIGAQVWMVENLQTTHYRDGTAISTSDYHWSNYDILNKSPYGAQYTFYAVANNHNICPSGWHIPTDGEWTTTIDLLGGGSIAGGKMKETGTIHWQSPNTGATNESGFTCLPKAPQGYEVFMWSSTMNGATTAYDQSLNNTSANINRGFNSLPSGYPVRCIQGEGVVWPLVSTGSITNITATTVKAGGSIVSNGGGSVTESGVCWSTSTGPIVTGSHSASGVTSGTFSCNVTGLTVGTQYYLRAYATNSAGTAYGDEISFVPVYAIGDTYQGGTIFYLTGAYPNQHGLVCSPADQSTGISWYNGSYVVTGATATAVGTGQANTNTIVSIQGTGSYAAQICNDLVLNGYSDWFLPSIAELTLMYTNLKANGLGNLSNARYWSSSEIDANFASGYNFNGGQESFNKYYSAYVRAVRAF